MDTQDLAAAFAAIRRQALNEAALVARQEVVVGNDLLDTEQGASAAAGRIADRLESMARLAQGADTSTALGTTVYVVCLKGRDGKPRGAEKVAAGAFYMVEEDATAALAGMGLKGFAVFPAILDIGQQPVTVVAEPA